MARNRLSWDKEKKAELEKKADPYTMNQDHPNPPASKYDIGGPSQFAEDPDKKTPWKNEGRVETGHPAPVRDAVKAANQLTDKALKCITIAQRILPGADDSIIEEQATDFMYLPDRCILATLQRQSELAEVLAKDNGNGNGDDDEDAPEEKADKAAKKDKKDKDAPEAEGDMPAPEAEGDMPAPEADKAAKKDKKDKDAPGNGDMPAPATEDEDVPENGKSAKAELDIELSGDNTDLLDSVFANEEKTGAKKLSGIVKKASAVNQLDGLWNAPPDVSKAFDVR